MIDTMLVTYTIGLAMGLIIGISVAILVDRHSKQREERIIEDNKQREEQIMENVKKFMEEKKNGRTREEHNDFI